MTLADTDTPESEPSGDAQFQEAVQLPGGVSARAATGRRRPDRSRPTDRRS